MAISKEKLQSILTGKAQQLCKSDKLLDKIVENHAGNDPDPNDYDDYMDFDRMYSDSVDDETYVSDMSYTNKSVMESNLPDNIKKSFINEKINTTPTGGMSVLDTLNVKQQKPKKKQRITEQVSSGVDNSSLKKLIMECLHEYFSKNDLNESTSLNTIRLKGGNISLIDNAGNVYSAQLKKLQD